VNLRFPNDDGGHPPEVSGRRRGLFVGRLPAAR
jgi:hypothetical protein